jgi:hypothetical protein
MQKNLSHVIRSIEDAIGFDDDINTCNYERFSSGKRNLDDDSDLFEKKKTKLKDSRKTELTFDDNIYLL